MNPRIDVERDAGVVQLTMNALPRPSTIDVETCVALSAALREIAETASDRVVVLRGAGSVFSAGGNLAKIEETIPDPPRLLAPLIDRFHEAMLATRRLPQP
jgi:enoyl-CoA hydratase/carnithine racemase